MSGTLATAPNFLKDWPWPRRLNTHYEQARADNFKWFASFGAFDVHEVTECL
jgi:hypothetical protein